MRGPAPAVQAALAKLLSSLGEGPLPLALLSLYLPEQYARIRTGELRNHARALLLDRVMSVLEDYSLACGQPVPTPTPAP